MVAHALLVRAAGTVVTGVVGVSAYELLRKAAGKAPVHRAAVTATALGLRGTRRAELAAEAARLKVADVVAEARDRVGEGAAPSIVVEADGDCCNHAAEGDHGKAGNDDCCS